jgi:bacteriorhodopsin
LPKELWLWLYVACMAGGALLFFRWSRQPKGVPHYEYTIAMVIPIWSGLAYTAMALGQGSLIVDGREVYVARYVDWIVTTPLLLWALASTAMFYRRLDKALIGGLMFTDAVMILSGLAADLTQDPPIKWFWYSIGCICLAIILWITWGPLRRIAHDQPHGLGKAYTKAAAYLSLLWLGYPLVWALGPSGLGILDSATDTMLFVFLPILSKVGFSILDLHELRKLGSREPSHSAGSHSHGTAYPAGAADQQGASDQREARHA